MNIAAGAVEVAGSQLGSARRRPLGSAAAGTGRIGRIELMMTRRPGGAFCSAGPVCQAVCLAVSRRIRHREATAPDRTTHRKHSAPGRTAAHTPGSLGRLRTSCTVYIGLSTSDGDLHVLEFRRSRRRELIRGRPAGTIDDKVDNA
jgi:hypothetical protein